MRVSPALPVTSGSAWIRGLWAWGGFVLVGGCFAFGFGVTQRLASDQNPEPAAVEVEAFAPHRFPGQRLERLRARHGDARPLLADVAAREAELAKLRPPEVDRNAIAPGQSAPASEQLQPDSPASDASLVQQQRPRPKTAALVSEGAGPGAAPMASVLHAPNASSLNAEALDAALDALLGGPIAVQEIQQPDRPRPLAP